MDNKATKANNITLNEPLKFTRDIIWVALYLIVATLLGVITLIALTKSYSADIYGVWAQISVTLNLLTPLITLQLSIAVVRFLAVEEDKEKRRRYMGSMISVIFLFGFLVFVAANFLVVPLSNLLFANPDYTYFVRLTFFWTMVDSLFLFLISYLRARGKIRRLSLIQVTFLLAKMVPILVLSKLALDLEWVLVFIIGVEIIFTLGLFYLVVRDIGFPVPNLAGLNNFLAFSAPQIPSGVLIWVIAASDRYFITHFLNLSITGIYSSSVLLASMVVLCYAPIIYALLPTISVAWEQKRIDDTRIYLAYSTKLFLTFAIPVAIGVALLSQPLLNILTTSEFLAGWEVVLLISIGVIFVGIYEINVFIIYLVKRTKWLPLFILIAALISIGLNIALIPRIGIMGAAVSNVSAYFVLATIITIWAQKFIRYRFNLKYLSKIIVATIVMAACLKFLPINGIPGIIMAVLVGSAVFIGVMMILRSFSDQDKRLVKNTFGGFIPWLH